MPATLSSPAAQPRSTGDAPSRRPLASSAHTRASRLSMSTNGRSPFVSARESAAAAARGSLHPAAIPGYSTSADLLEVRGQLQGSSPEMVRGTVCSATSSGLWTVLSCAGTSHGVDNDCCTRRQTRVADPCRHRPRPQANHRTDATDRRDRRGTLADSSREHGVPRSVGSPESSTRADRPAVNARPPCAARCACRSPGSSTVSSACRPPSRWRPWDRSPRPRPSPARRRRCWRWGCGNCCGAGWRQAPVPRAQPATSAVPRPGCRPFPPVRGC
jgi:hypothetical protein